MAPSNSRETYQHSGSITASVPPQQTAPQRQPDTERAFIGLGQELNALENLAGRVSERLQPICCAQQPTPAKQNDQHVSATCKVSAEVDAIAQRICNLRHLLDDIDNRLEV